MGLVRVLAALVLVVLAELVILVVARTRLVCYRCRSRFAQTPIAPYHAVFDPQVAQLAANQPSEPATDEDPEEASEEPIMQPESRRTRLARMRIQSVEEATRELDREHHPDEDREDHTDQT